MLTEENCYKNFNYNFNDKEIFLTNCLFIGPVLNPIKNEFFNCDLANIFTKKNLDISENEYLYLRNNKKYRLEKFFEIEKFNISSFRKSLDFSSISLNDNERIFAFFNIISDRKKEIILKIGRTNNFKLWMNGLLIYNKASTVYNGFYESVGFGDSIFINISLNKGNNLLILELNKYSQMISLKLGNKILSEETNIFKEYYNTTCLNKINIVDYTNICTNMEKYEFMIIPKDFLNVKLSTSFLVEIKIANKLTKIFRTNFYEKNIINLLNFNDNNNCIMNIFIFYKDINGSNITHVHRVLLPNYLKVKEYLNARVKNNIFKYLEIIENDIPLKMIPWIVSEEYDKIIELNYNSKFCLGVGGFYRIFFQSKLDNTLQNLCIYLPLNFSNNKNYSIVIHLVPSVSGNFIKFHSQQSYNDNIIFVEFSTRGVTQGSYIGEYSILESLKILKKILKLKKYIFNFIGYSTGAFSVWSIAQNYPYLINSLVTISGFPYYENLCNLNNIPILNISADNDDMFKRAFEEPTNFFKNSNSKYKGLVLDESDHLTIMNTLFSKYTINFLAKQISNRNNKISFRTERIRHNKTNYFKILDFDNDYAKIDSSFYEDKIYIKVKNINSFIFYCPRFLKNKNYIIYIENNKKIFKFFIRGKKKLLFKLLNNDFYLYYYNINEKILLNNKGMGLLNIYMDNVKILTPNVKNKESKILLNQIAESLKNLKTMGYEPNVNVNFESKYVSYLDKDICCNNNLILINEGNNTLLHEIIKYLPIKPYSNGFYYKNKFFEGDYCILFITQNPFNSKKQILVVYSTKYQLFKSNYFLRNFIIPSYSNGLNKWLNAECLIYKEKKYKIINSIGDDITII